MEKQRGDSSSGSSPSSLSPPTSSSFWTFLNAMMVEPLGAELTNNKRNDPIGSPCSQGTFTTEEDRQQHQQNQQRRQNPLSASESIKAIARIPNSGEFQIYEDDDNNNNNIEHDNHHHHRHHHDEDDDSEDSETEWGSCVEYEEATPTVPQHELLNCSMMSLDAKLGLEPVAQRRTQRQRVYVEKDGNKEEEEEEEEEHSQTRGLAAADTTKATDAESNSSESSERTPSSSATSSSSSSPSSFGKKTVSLRAPMSHDEMKLMSSRLEQRFQSHLETSRQEHQGQQQYSTKFQSTKMRSSLTASSTSLGTMDGDWTAHSKPPEIEIQLRANNNKQPGRYSDEHCSSNDSSSSSFGNNNNNNNNNGLPPLRPSMTPLPTKNDPENDNAGGGDHKRSSSRTSLHQNRLGQMKSRWESMKGGLGESSDICVDNDLDSSSSSSSNLVESLSSEDNDDDSNNKEHVALKLKTKKRISSRSAPTNTANNQKIGPGGELRGSTKSAPPDDRRAAMMMESRRPSGNRMKALMAFKEATKSVRSNITTRENFNFRSMVRKTREIDMETGATMTREFTAKRIVDEEFFQPMNPNERRKKLFMKKRLQSKKQLQNFNVSLTRGNNPMNYRTGAKRDLFGAQEEEEKDEPIHQYRLSSMIAKHDSVFFGNHLNLLREYLYWCLRKSFIFVLLSESLVFLAWCWGFAIWYYILGRLNPQCIQGAGGYDFEEGNMSLVDAFTLSWTTFSTVGYGHIYPSIHKEDASTGCILITGLTSLQSFVGVLSASFCSAVIFAKVAKYQSIAHVMFSNTVVIRFGQELMQHVPVESEPDLLGKFKFNIPYAPGNDSSKSGVGLKSGKTGKAKILDRRRRSSVTLDRYPCPIMEFRVVNLLHKEAGGEIMNCRLNVVASSLEEVTKTDKKKNASFFDNVVPSKQVAKSMKAIQNAAKTTTERSKSLISTSGELMKRGSLLQNVNRAFSTFGAGSSPYSLDGSKTDTEVEGQPFKEGESSSGVDDLNPFHQSLQLENLLDDDLSSSSSNKQNFRDQYGRSQSIFVDEEPCNTGDRAANSRRVFSKVEIETDSHPFFKRVWNIRHILNEDSPLLTAETRKVIRLNGGLWPASLCNPDDIEGCLEISQLIVSLSGTAVVSGSSVYKLQVYERGFVEIGKTFENPLIRDPDGKLTIDMQLVHSTKAQFEEELSDADDLHNARRFSFRSSAL